MIQQVVCQNIFVNNSQSRNFKSVGEENQTQTHKEQKMAII